MDSLQVVCCGMGWGCIILHTLMWHQHAAPWVHKQAAVTHLARLGIAGPGLVGLCPPLPPVPPSPLPTSIPFTSPAPSLLPSLRSLSLKFVTA